jgi:ATP-dependent Lhr-like helicase
VEPVDQSAYARFLPAWQHVGSDRRGLDALAEALATLAGAPIVASTLEGDVLASRVRSYRPADLDQLCTSGELVWVGAGALGARDGRVRLCFADQLPLLAPGWEAAGGAEPEGGALHDAIRGLLAASGASFWGQLRAADPTATDDELLAALWDLVWAGEVTNDSFAPVRSAIAGRGSRSGSTRGHGRPYAGGRPRPGRLTRLGPPAGQGRWSLVASLRTASPSPTEATHAQALQLVERYGVVTREAVLAEGLAGGFSGVYGVLKVLEERGQVRRGYFVDGLGAAQFAVPGAIDRLRAVRDTPDLAIDPDDVPPPIVLAATDPAQPYGAALAWPPSAGRPARSASAIVVLRAGTPLVWFDRRAHHLQRFPAGERDAAWVDSLVALVKYGRVRSIEVRKVDSLAVGDPDVSASVLDGLRTAGFADGYRGLTLRS